MQQNAIDTDLWLTESFGRGHGALVGRITRKGARQFYYRYFANGKQVRESIGSFSTKGNGHSSFSVAQARAVAMEWATLHRSGVADLSQHFKQLREDQLQLESAQRERLSEEARQRDLALEELAALRKRQITIRQLFERWCETQLQPKIRTDGKRIGRKDGGQYARESFGRHVFPSLGETILPEVTKANLMEVLDKLTNAGKMRTANHLLADLKQMLNFALERELITVNPLALISKKNIGGANTPRKRFLSEEEIKALALQMPKANLNPRSELGIWLTISAAVRSSELTGAVWLNSNPAAPKLSETKKLELQEKAALKKSYIGFVDLINRQWYLPSSKNQRDHTIHLSDFSLRILKDLFELRVQEKGAEDRRMSPWVFPGTDNRYPVCVKSLGKQIADRRSPEKQPLKNRSKNPTALVLSGGRWTPHDLRRTASTAMGGLGFSKDVINECLNHINDNKMSQTYIHDRSEAEQIKAFDALGKYLEKLVCNNF
jgi:integrase